MGVFRYIGAILNMLKDKSVALWKKLLVVFGVVYLVSPIEILPDFLLPVGFIDDIILWVIILYIINSSLNPQFKGKKNYSSKYKGRDIIETEDYQVEEQ